MKFLQVAARGTDKTDKTAPDYPTACPVKVLSVLSVGSPAVSQNFRPQSATSNPMARAIAQSPRPPETPRGRATTPRGHQNTHRPVPPHQPTPESPQPTVSRNALR